MSQAPVLPPYGESITLAQAKQVAGAAIAIARASEWCVAVAVVDTGGHLVYLEKLDQTAVGCVAVAGQKARSAAVFKRRTQVFQERLAHGGEELRLLRLDGAVPVEGGVPIIVGGKLVGAIGVSGAAGAEDTVCAEAGAAAVSR
jgi:glc operon protein GlcG